VHITIKETLSASILREGGLLSLELKGEMNLAISDSALAHIRLVLAPPSSDGGLASAGTALQFKQHPQVAKFGPQGQERVVALKNPDRGFPVGQALAVLKWRYAGTDESYIPLSGEFLHILPNGGLDRGQIVSCWPTPSNDGTCLVNIEYELENTELVLHDVVVSIPLPAGSYPTVASGHTGDWALNPSSHSLDWALPLVSGADDDLRTGSLEFTVGGDDAGAFFPVRVAFVAQGSMAGVKVLQVLQTSGNGEVVFSEDTMLASEEYVVN
jgi:hypothetical protein